jgi:hypothetical protein
LELARKIVRGRDRQQRIIEVTEATASTLTRGKFPKGYPQGSCSCSHHAKNGRVCIETELPPGGLHAHSSAHAYIPVSRFVLSSVKPDITGIYLYSSHEGDSTGVPENPFTYVAG